MLLDATMLLGDRAGDLTTTAALAAAAAIGNAYIGVPAERFEAVCRRALDTDADAQRTAIA